MGIGPRIFAIFFLLAFIADAAPLCVLLEKNIESRAYKFKCDKDILNIQCEDKDANFCRMEVKSKLKSANFKVTGDELEAFGLFSSSAEVKIDCDRKSKLCTVNEEVCDQYTGSFNEVLKNASGDATSSGVCNSTFGPGIINVGNFSGQIISSTDFNQDDCKSNSAAGFESLISKIALFKRNMQLPVSSNNSFFNKCLYLSKTDQSNSEFISRNLKSFENLQKKTIEQLSSSSKVRELVCEPRFENLYLDKKMSLDKAICLVMETAKIELNDEATRHFKCDFSASGHNGNRSFSNKGASGREISATDSAASNTPLEQKPMPVAIEGEMAKPVGLRSALAKVDQAIPSSYESSGYSEGSIATGAVRNNIPLAALQAGQAIAPVYEKLSRVGNAASSLVSKGSTAVIGRNSPGSVNPSLATNGFVTRNSEVQPLDTSSLGNIGVSKTMAGKTPASASIEADVELGTTSVASKTSGQQGAALGGAKGVGLQGSSLSSSGSGPSRTPALEATAVDFGASSSNSSVYQKIYKLSSSDQVKNFFTNEAQSIPDFRDFIYKDEATKKMLAIKGIKIVDRRGNSSGDLSSKPKYLISDNGVTFVPMTVKTKK